tara:strand:- start:788 stop:1282 length:495 start_codon:yes stop_codon:yes gene_type:complete
MASYTTSAGKHFADFAICDDEYTRGLAAAPPSLPPRDIVTPPLPEGSELREAFKEIQQHLVSDPKLSKKRSIPDWATLSMIENVRLKARIAELEKANKSVWANYDYRCEQLHDIELKLSGLLSRWDDHDEEVAKDNYDNDETILLTPNKTRKDELKDAVFTSAL